MSTVDPLNAALGDQPERAGTGDGGNPDGAAAIDHPILQRFGGADDPEAVRKALDAYQNLDSAYGRQGSELGQKVANLEAELAAMNTPQAPQQSDPNAVPDLQVDQLQQWYDEDPLQATAYVVAQGNNALVTQFKEMLDERLKPVEETTGMTRSTMLIENLNKDLGGDVVARNQDVILDIIKNDPDMLKGSQVQVYKRVKAMINAADSEKGNQRGASNDGAGKRGVAVEGGSGGRNPQPDANSEIEEFIKAMVTPDVQTNNILGLPERRP